MRISDREMRDHLSCYERVYRRAVYRSLERLQMPREGVLIFGDSIIERLSAEVRQFRVKIGLDRHLILDQHQARRSVLFIEPRFACPLGTAGNPKSP